MNNTTNTAHKFIDLEKINELYITFNTGLFLSVEITKAENEDNSHYKIVLTNKVKNYTKRITQTSDINLLYAFLFGYHNALLHALTEAEQEQ
jgi:hypothetical protein